MGNQIFEGVKILDLTWVGVGPITTRFLADHGAFVIHVESHTRPETLRMSPPFKDGIAGVDRAAFMADYNSSKYGISLDLNKEKGRELVKRFLLDWKPDIIYYSACQQGHFGPHRMFAGYGMMGAALAGYAHITGWPDRLPAIPYGAYTDFISPFYGTIAVVAALDYRRKTGKGQYLDLSQFECGLQLLAPALMDYALTGREICRVGNRHPSAAPHGIYPCRGVERWCSIAVFTDEEWKAFCGVIGHPDLAEDPKFQTLMARKQNEDELDELVGEWTKDYPPEQVMSMMQDAGVAAGVVQSMEDIFADPQIKHRGYLVLLNHSAIGPHHYDGHAFRLSKTPGKLRMPGPCLGEHNEYIYKEILGLSEDDIADLIIEGVITTEADLPVVGTDPT